MKYVFRIISCITLLLGLCACNSAEEGAGAPPTIFRVINDHGTPRLTVNGKPTRPYIFWGHAMRGSNAKVTEKWRDISFDFTAPCDDPNGSLHLYFGTQKGVFQIAKVRVREQATGQYLLDDNFSDGQAGFEKQWRVWCSGKAENSPSILSETIRFFPNDKGGNLLELTLTRDRHLHSFILFNQNLKLQKDHVYSVEVRIRADAELYFNPGCYNDGNQRFYGGIDDNLFADQVKLAAKQGVRFVSCGAPIVWSKPGETPDYQALEHRIRGALKANPDAWLIPRIRLKSPGWWKKSHPDDMMHFENGDPSNYEAVASQAYRRDACKALRQTILYCEKHFAKNIAGYHPTGANTGEWFYYNTWGKFLSGYSPATRSAWRKWLSNKYGTDAALQSAWHNPNASLANAEVPSPESRRGNNGATLFEPSTNAPVMDFNHFLQDAMAGCVLDLAQTVREAAGPNKLSVFFYGYNYEFSGVRNGPATSGHYGLRKILSSPNIDVLASPISYVDRALGGGGPSMTSAESVSLAGKLWLNEDDTSTHIAFAVGNNFPGHNNGAKTPEESANLLRRGLGVTGCRNFATWWMDLGGGGWFNDPELWKQMEFFDGLNREVMEKHLAFRPQIATLLDERSMLHVNKPEYCSRNLMYLGRTQLNRIGAPYGQYLLDDFLNGKVNAKLRAFLGTYALTGGERRILRLSAKEGATIWAWAPGYIDLDTGKFSLDAVEELTGFKTRLLPANTTALVKSTPEGLAAGLPEEFGPNKALTPLLSPQTNEGDVVLATYAGGEPAVVLRSKGKAHELFCGTTVIPSALYRHMAKLGGVHLYAKQDLNVCAIGSYISLHGAEDGEVILDTGKTGKVWSEFERKYIGKGPEVKLQLRKGQSLLLRLD